MDKVFFSNNLDNLTYADILNFTGILRPESERPQEGVRLDFKIEIPNNLGDTITAFANTYGGLLIIGIRADKTRQNVPIEIPGIESRPDIKSTIVNKILSSVYPRPPFIVKVLEHGEKENHVVIIIKVDESRIPPHMFVAGHANKVSVRIEDTDKYASLQQIEMLFDKRKKISLQDFNHNLDELSVFWINESGDDSRSPNYHNVMIGPLADSNLRLDRKMERRFNELIKQFFYKDQEFDIEDRDAKYYQTEARNKEVDFHRKWRLYSNGTVGFASQAGKGQPKTEYLGDMIIDTFSVFFLYKTLMEDAGYWGKNYFRHGMSFIEETILEPKMPPSNMTCNYSDYDIMQGIRLESGASRKLPPIRKEHAIDRYLDFSDIEKPEEILTDNFMEHLRKIFLASIDFEKLLESISILAGRLQRKL